MNTFTRNALTFHEGLARIVYGIVAVIYPLLVLLLWSRWFTHRPSRTGADFAIMLLVPVIVIFVIVWPAARAWWRVKRGGLLLPWWCLRRRPVIGSMVTSAGLLCLVIPVSAEILLKDYFHVRPGEFHPMTWFWWVGFGLAALALTSGEWLVVGRDTSETIAEPLA